MAVGTAAAVQDIARLYFVLIFADVAAERDRRRIVYIFPALPDDEIPVDSMKAFQKTLHRQPLGGSPAGMRTQRTSPAVEDVRRGYVPFVPAFQKPEPGLFERFHIRADDDHVIPSGFQLFHELRMGFPHGSRTPGTAVAAQQAASDRRPLPTAYVAFYGYPGEAVFVCPDDRDLEIPRFQRTHELRVTLFLHHAIGLSGKTEEPAFAGFRHFAMDCGRFRCAQAERRRRRQGPRRRPAGVSSGSSTSGGP